MSPEDLYNIWAPENGRWSAWVSPTFFTNLDYVDAIEEKDDLEIQLPKEPCAVVIDLPGERAIRLAMQLAASDGYRPVPVINAMPGPVYMGLISSTTWNTLCTVDMSGLATALCAASPRLAHMALKPEALPVFLVDRARMYGSGPVENGIFDNRWRVFPQDFPSAAFLRSCGIEKVVLVEDFTTQPQQDLAHVLRRYQDAGLQLFDREGATIDVVRPPMFGLPLYRLFSALSLRRNKAGGFGAIVRLPDTNRNP